MKMLLHRLLLVLLNCTCALYYLYASDSLLVAKININQGLSNNSIRCIYQDHDGFMWFGTYDGLNRYDGYDFKIFRNKPNDTASLPHNYINAIGEDHHNNLWVGTGQGIGIYNKLTAKFLPGYYFPYGAKQSIRIPFNINEIKIGTQGDLYIATNGSGLLLKPDGSNIAIEMPFFKDGKIFSGSNIQGITIDTKQKLWVTIAGFGLFNYNMETKNLQLVNSKFKDVRCMQAIDDDNLWIATYYGLFKYNIPTNTITQPFDEQSGSLTSNVISMALDRKGLLWLGTEGGGLNILNTKTEKLDYILPGDNKTTLSSKTVFAVYEDKEGRKWIGTYKGGIDIIDPQKSKFQSVSYDPLNPNSLGSNFISAFYNDKAGNLWIGSDGGGISIWNRHTNTFTTYRHSQKNPQSLSHNSVPCIIEDYLGDIWIATFGEGINKFNKANHTLEHFACMNEQTGLESKYVWRLYEDKDKNLWATTYANGRLFKFNRTTNRFEVFCKEQADLFCLLEDNDGALWAGNAYGVCKIDEQNRTFVQYNISKPVRAIVEKDNHQLWLGTEGLGLILFDKTKGQVAAAYSDANGLCNNSVLNILKSDNGNLWLSTFHGLSEFNPTTKKIKSFYQEDGLPSNQFEYNAALKLPSGEMVFGGVNGFALFHPDSLQVETSTPAIFLTGLRVNNEEVTANSKYVSKIDNNNFQQLKIPYNDAVLSFDFTALEYALPEKINYAYYLEGWDKGWTNAGSLRTANYTRLKEGTYHLHIKNTNAAGVWNPREITLEIIILPPWFRSWWAYLIYACILFVLIYQYNGYRVRQAKLQYEVQLAQMEVQKEKELNEKKLSFFTDISHEFRTPLTLIINPVKDMLDDPEKRKDSNFLQSAYRNARRLLSLVDQLLLFRKAETESNKLKISKINFSNLCQDVYSSFEQEAKSRKIEYTYNCPADLYIYGDRQKLEIALYNLLSNAIKYTPVAGKIGINITETDDEVITTITDNGPGIPTESGDKIFDTFYQAINKDSITKSGFGIGLSLVKSIAESHHGNIVYTSVAGKGAIFTLTLTKGKEVFAHCFIGEEEIVDTPKSDSKLSQTEANETPVAKLDDLMTDSATLLVVEDNEQLRNYIVSIFSPHYKVYDAFNAEQALQIAREQLPDIIISDNLMGGMTGMELCQIIKKDAALGHIPVIIVTGSHSPEGRLEGMKYGADDYITKPFEKDFLMARVANLLQSRSLLQNYFYNEITLQKNDLKVSEEYKCFLDNCIAIVEKHLDDEDFSVKTLANEIGMSHSKIYRIVKSISGQSVNAFIRYIRLRKAAELLISTNLNVNETSFEVGIGDVRYFRAQFNKLFGMNPSEYIKKYRKAYSGGYRLNKDALKKDTPQNL